ncbi:hypothetical protein [Celeribacter marinus]|uniref:Uncharacterized protein n=1 Tax=Celeribacter marinus TaxID=1397108 RepID=A0A0P0AD13_9RHOB|nr:hypothetical protein [Celeribacter marinus]ALI56780.1 hypothetical protein IMCC12053_2833 [Celeribacter marinus]
MIEVLSNACHTRVAVIHSGSDKRRFARNVTERQRGEGGCSSVETILSIVVKGEASDCYG